MRNADFNIESLPAFSTNFQPQTFDRLMYSVFRIPYSVFRIPYSVFRIPHSAFLRGRRNGKC